MPNTAKGAPYPAGTDSPDVPRDIEAAVEHFDARVGRASYVGSVSVPVSAANNATAVVTYPVGKFTATPTVIVSTSGTSFWCAFVAATSPTAFTAQVRHIDGTSATATPTVNYRAEQFA